MSSLYHRGQVKCPQLLLAMVLLNNDDYRRKYPMIKKGKKLIHITAMALLQSAIPQVVIYFTLMTHVPA